MTKNRGWMRGDLRPPLRYSTAGTAAGELQVRFVAGTPRPTAIGLHAPYRRVKLRTVHFSLFSRPISRFMSCRETEMLHSRFASGFYPDRVTVVIGYCDLARPAASPRSEVQRGRRTHALLQNLKQTRHRQPTRSTTAWAAFAGSRSHRRLDLHHRRRSAYTARP